MIAPSLDCSRAMVCPLTATLVMNCTSTTLLATSLFGDPAAGFRADVSAELREHPAFLRPLNPAPGLVLADICIWFWPLTVICRAWRRGQCRVDGSRPARRHR